MTNQTTSSLDTAPATGSGCGCGSAPAATVEATPAPAASPCCGTAEGAAKAGACCDPTAKTDALAAGASCCG
jgi:hypothetical protein